MAVSRNCFGLFGSYRDHPDHFGASFVDESLFVDARDSGYEPSCLCHDGNFLVVASWVRDAVGCDAFAWFPCARLFANARNDGATIGDDAFHDSYDGQPLQRLTTSTWTQKPQQVFFSRFIPPNF